MVWRVLDSSAAFGFLGGGANGRGAGAVEGGLGILGVRAGVIGSVFLSQGRARGGVFGTESEVTVEREAD